MFDTRDEMRQSFVHKTFLRANMDQAIRNDQFRPVDIEPILNHLTLVGREQFFTHDRSQPQNLKVERCLLFLRLYNIERIDLKDRCCNHHSTDSCAQGEAEKRLGSRVRKTVHIKRHSDLILCLVEGFRAHHRRHAYHQCTRPQPVLPLVAIHYLITDMRDCCKQIYAQRISNHIHSLIQCTTNAADERTLQGIRSWGHQLSLACHTFENFQKDEIDETSS